MSTLTISIICGMLALVGLGISNAAIKPLAQKLTPIHGVFWRNGFMSLLWVGVVIVSFAAGWMTIEWSPVIFVAIAFGFALYISLVLLYTAITHGKVGVVMPIANGNTFITAIIGLLVFGQVLAWNQWLAIVVIIFGVLLFSFDFTDWKKSAVFRKGSGVPLAIIVLLIWGVLFGFAAWPALALGPVFYALIIETTMFICAGLHLAAKGQLSFFLPKGYIGIAVLSGGMAFVASIGQNVGIALGTIGIVAAFMGANPLAAVLYARFVYGERLQRKEHIAMLVTMLGIILISIA